MNLDGVRGAITQSVRPVTANRVYDIVTDTAINLLRNTKDLSAL